MSTSDTTVHLEIGSRLENVELVQIAVEAALNQLQVEQGVSDLIGTAVREAVANAIKHGNGSNPAKQVEVEFGLEGDEIVIQVTDQGAGFNPETIPDPLEPENLLRPHGRGILLIKEFMDTIDYSFEPGKGTVLVMRKQVEIPVPGSDQKEEEDA